MKNIVIEKFAIPVAIIVAGAFIAVAIFFAFGNQKNTAPLATVRTPQQQIDTTSKVRPVGPSDYIRGSKNPKVTIVEYSDLECPFCKRFNATLKTILKDNKDVAWVYRQFPIVQLHPKNTWKASVAAECAGKLGGNAAFWKFTDGYFAVTPSNDQTDIATVIPALAKQIGLNKKAFESCEASGQFDARIKKDIANAKITGAQGTPWSIIISPKGKTFPLSGSQPLAAVQQLIDIARKN